MYNVLEEPDDSSADTTVMHTAVAATTGSTLGNSYQASIIPAELTAAINTIAANQQSLYHHIAPLLQQMATLSFQAQPTIQARWPAFQAPPVHQLAIPGPPAYRGSTRGVPTGVSTRARRRTKHRLSPKRAQQQQARSWLHHIC